MSKFITLLAMSLLIALSGCATSKYDPNTYSGSQANAIGGYHVGVVRSVRPVSIQDSTTGIGAGSGATVGAVAGSSIGGGSGRIVGGVLGALTMGLIGNTIEANTTAKTDAQEITVVLTDNREIMVVQENTQNIQAGEKVKLVAINGNFRIVRY